MENDAVRVTVLHEGGHIAEVFDKAAGVSPLWVPPWPTIEPSQYSAAHANAYGDGNDARLLAGIMGHNLCLDIFGPASDEEAAQGLTAHGEGSVVRYDVDVRHESLTCRGRFPIAGLRFERRIDLRHRVLAIRETLENVSGSDRAIGWTQHVTLGPPFLEHGSTQFRASATRSRAFESAFGADDYLRPSADFDWPFAPRLDGGTADLRQFAGGERSSAYTAHLMDPNRSTAWFVAFSPAFNLSYGYVWRPDDFPWMGIWEEHRSRLHQPWNGQTISRGMEFGVSPMPETREAMIARGQLFGVPGFRRIPAGGTIEVEYRAMLQRVNAIPESLDWPA
jgi:hypothetical protein